MSRHRTETFSQNLAHLERTTDDALRHDDPLLLSAAAQIFGDATLLPDYDPAAQIRWLTPKLADHRFLHSETVHEFLMTLQLYSDRIAPASQEDLQVALLAALTEIEGDADLVCAMEFLVKARPADIALKTIQTKLVPFATHERLREFVHDAMRMYSLRDDISPTQLTQIQALAKAHFS